MSTTSKTTPIRSLDELDTPFLHLDKRKFLANVQSLKSRISSLGVTLRPHMKTVRSLDAASHIIDSFSAPITVSTLAEAEAYAQAGYNNQVYAVGITPTKLARVAQLRAQGTDITVLLDSIEQADCINNYCATHGCVIPALIEIDSDDVRAGIRFDDPNLIEIATALNKETTLLRGVLTHAGGSYKCKTPETLQAMAQQEINAVVYAAEQLKKAGFGCEIISVGSTPTAYFADKFTGITEVRAGVYHFFDLVMADLGVCQLDDIALSVTTTIIGHNQRKGWLLVDAGWTAISSDTGSPDIPGYGMVVDQDGQMHTNLRVLKLSQEHGVITDISGGPIDFGHFSIGSRIQILPNHACSMATMHGHYVVSDPLTEQIEFWSRIMGW